MKNYFTEFLTDEISNFIDPKQKKFSVIVRDIRPGSITCAFDLVFEDPIVDSEDVGLNDNEQDLDEFFDSVNSDSMLGGYEVTGVASEAFPPDVTCDEVSEFKCTSGFTCIPISWRCDKIVDCPIAEDEVNCTLSDYDLRLKPNETNIEQSIYSQIRPIKVGQLDSNLIQECNSTYYHKSDKAAKVISSNYPNYYDHNMENCWQNVVSPEDYFLVHYMDRFATEGLSTSNKCADDKLEIYNRFYSQEDEFSDFESLKWANGSSISYSLMSDIPRYTYCGRTIADTVTDEQDLIKNNGPEGGIPPRKKIYWYDAGLIDMINQDQVNSGGSLDSSHNYTLANKITFNFNSDDSIQMCGFSFLTKSIPKRLLAYNVTESCPTGTYDCTTTNLHEIYVGPEPRCIPTSFLCDGVQDCSDGADEDRAICDANGVAYDSNRFNLELGDMRSYSPHRRIS